MKTNLFKKHPLIATFLISLFASFPVSMITELIAIAIGPERVNQFVRETIVVFWVAGMLGILAFVGFREAKKRGHERRRIAQTALIVFSSGMALMAFVILASNMIILIDAIVTGNYSLK